MKNSRVFLNQQWIDDVVALVFIFITLKAVLLGVAIIADHSGFFCTLCHESNIVWSGNVTRSPVSVLQTWDSQSYLQLADTWYVAGEKSIAFFPLLPALIRGVWTLPGNAFFNAQIFITTLSVGMVVSFYTMITVLSQPRIAFWATLLLITFPTGFFLHVMYTEALFILLFSLLVTGFLRQWPHWLMFCMSASIVISRPHGIVAIAGIIFTFSLLRLHGISQKRQVRTIAAILQQTIPPIIGICAGLCLYFINMYWFTGNVWAGFVMQKNFGSQFGWSYLKHPLQWVHDTFFIDSVFLSINHSALSQLIFFLTVIQLVFLWRSRFFRLFFPVTLALFFMSVIPGTLASYARYAISLIMVFPATAELLLRDTTSVFQKRIAFGALLMLTIISGITQALLFFYHANNLWIG